MTTRVHIRTSDLAALLEPTASPYGSIDPDVTLRCWLALNSTDPTLASATLAEVADLYGLDAANAIVATMTDALDAAGPDGIPA